MNGGQESGAARKETLDRLLGDLVDLADALEAASRSAGHLIGRFLGPTCYAEPGGQSEDRPPPQGLLSKCFSVVAQARADLVRLHQQLELLTYGVGAGEEGECDAGDDAFARELKRRL